MNRQEIFELVQKYNRGECNADEVALLETWYLNENSLYHTELPESRMETDLQDVYLKLPEPIKKYKLWPHIAVVAAAVAAITVGIWFYTSRNPVSNPELLTVNQNDIAPGKNMATITLTNGKTINLSNAKTGVIIGAAKLTYSDGSPVTGSLQEGVMKQTPTEEEIASPLQDIGLKSGLTISTPRGGIYQIRLPDGTAVWLNSATTLKYPASFSEPKIRRVELSGEAYFEVAKDKTRPFIVSTANQEVTVLGTHFNINAYSDEPVTKTSLLEGSIKISGLSGTAVVMKPDQQAINTGTEINLKKLDREEAMAWKNGDFFFRDDNFRTTMRKVARWYNVDIIYSASAPNDLQLGGWIPRTENISAILKLMELTGKVHFKIEGRKITVTK